MTQTLSLSAISLASKATESPRRLRDIILPAHRLLHPETSVSNLIPIEQPLAIPSPTYDTLRGTVVQAEILLLRILGFELRLPSPLDFLQRYLERAMEDVTDVAEDYDNWDREGKEEFGIGEIMDTRLARAARQKAVEA